MKQASIDTEKVVVGETQCRKILGFNDVLTFDDCPSGYSVQGLSFYMGYSSGGPSG
jgi:hypothetical protein